MAAAGIDPGTRQRLTARFGPAVEGWFEALPDRLASLAQRWRIEYGAPIPRGSVSVVLRCRMVDGRPAVLKTSPDRPRLAAEAAALGEWTGGHSATVIALDEELGALLLESIDPGTPLDATVDYPAVEAVAELLGALHLAVGSDRSYPHVAQRVADLFESSAALYRRHPDLAQLVPPSLYERGRILATRLAEGATTPVLLHGDLTPANILDGGADRGLVAIDPAPCLGDAEFDAVDLTLWLADDPAKVEARAERLAAAAGLDGRRLLDWCRAFAAMGALELASQACHGPRLRALLALAGQG